LADHLRRRRISNPSTAGAAECHSSLDSRCDQSPGCCEPSVQLLRRKRRAFNRRCQRRSPLCALQDAGWEASSEPAAERHYRGFCEIVSSFIAIWTLCWSLIGRHTKACARDLNPRSKSSGGGPPRVKPSAFRTMTVPRECFVRDIENTP
jgi:hypothetical protein